MPTTFMRKQVPRTGDSSVYPKKRVLAGTRILYPPKPGGLQRLPENACPGWFADFISASKPVEKIFARGIQAETSSAYRRFQPVREYL